MDKEKLEEMLQELLNPELEQSRKTEILQELRVGFSTVSAELEELTKANEKLQKDNNDLVISNSKLFRQLGTLGDESKEEEVEKKEFSETVTLEELENNAIN